MLDKLKSHTHPGHFAAYSASYLIYGLCLTGLGPLIPYFSQNSGIIETEYSFLFSCRSFGMLGGALALKFIHKHFPLPHHKYMIWASLILFFASAFFSWSSSLFFQGVWMSLSAVGYSILEIEVNVCTLKTNPQQNAQFWMLLTHGVFGIGGLIAPLFVYIFEINSFAIFGLFFLLSIPAYHILPSPQDDNPELEDQNQTPSRQRVTPRNIEILLCITLFTYVGAELAYGGWISSYSILAGIDSKESATVYPSIFWIFMTLFRFTSAFMPGTTADKMKMLLYGIMGSGVLCLLLVYAGHALLMCYLSAVIFGISMSAFYILVLTVSAQYGFTLAEYQMGNIVTAGVLGEGFLTMFVGVLMQKVHINMLFYALILMAAAMELMRRICVQQFQSAEPKVADSQQQLRERLIAK